jgi:hypothetical protein
MSPAKTAKDLVADYRKALRDPDQAKALQNFYNEGLGLPRVAKGRGLQSSEIDAVIEPERMAITDFKTTPEVDVDAIGIDQGSNGLLYWSAVYWEYDEKDPTGYKRIDRGCGICDWGSADTLLRNLDPRTVVLDAKDDTDEALAFAKRWPSIVFIAYWAEQRTTDLCRIQEDEFTEKLVVQKVQAFDRLYKRIWAGTERISLPNGLPAAFREHMLAPKRVVERETKTGNQVAKWKTSEIKADHFAHAAVYAEISTEIVVPGVVT